MSGKKEGGAGLVRAQKIAGRSRRSAAPSGAGKGGGGISREATEKLATVIAGAIVLAIVAGAGILLVAMGGKAYRYVVSTDRLLVEEIEVEGVAALTADEVVRLSGVRKRSAILGVDLAAAAARVRTHPRIGSAVVERHLPRRIVIKVTERTPVALVQQDGIFRGIDATGAILPIIPSRENIKGPVLTGNIKQTAPDLLSEALSVLDQLRPDLSPRISELRMDGTGGITLLTTGTPIVIRLGRGEMTRKLERLRATLRLIEERGEQKEYIDLRFQDTITRP